MFFVGYFSFALALGFLLGASNSPVVGAFLTALIGLIGTVLAAPRLIENSQDGVALGKLVGKALTVFALALVIGELLGESHRHGWLVNQDRTFPWGRHAPPANTHEVVDWIVLQEHMRSIGYSPSQITELYKIRLNERNRLKEAAKAEDKAESLSNKRAYVYDESNPFSESLGAVNQPSSSAQDRGPASIP